MARARSTTNTGVRYFCQRDGGAGGVAGGCATGGSLLAGLSVSMATFLPPFACEEIIKSDRFFFWLMSVSSRGYDLSPRGRGFLRSRALRSFIASRTA
jgi:hypothetical protein